MKKLPTLIAALSAVIVGGIIAAVVIIHAGVFTESFTGTPPAPLSFDSEHWETASHHGWGVPTEFNDFPTLAQHTATCGSPQNDGTGTHTVQALKDLVFQCNDHVMTHIPGDGGSYDVIYMTPDQMVDLSGTATIRFDVSTLATSSRDWIDLWIQAWDTQEQKVLSAASFTPTNQGNPRSALHVEMGGVCSSVGAGEGKFHIDVFDASRALATCIGASNSWLSVLTPSAVTRSTVELVITPGHVKLWMPNNGGLVLSEGTIPALGFSQGVVSFGHHAYSPEKGANPSCVPTCNGIANTWHWDEISINPAVPFTIIGSDHRGAFYNESDAARTFIFGRPAPANSFLRFEGFGDQIKASYDGGAFNSVVRTGSFEHQEHSTSYFSPIPTGATRVTLRVDAPSYGSIGMVAEIHVFSKTVGGGTPTPTPTPTSTPTPTPIPTPTPTPPAQTTITFDDLVGQNQVLNGQYPSGLINWGTNVWWLSAPWGPHTTKSVSFNVNGTSKTFAFVSPKVLDSIDAGGISPSTITLLCSGNTNKVQAIPANTLVTIATGWTTPCTTVTVGSSNGWDTNFDTLKVH